MCFGVIHKFLPRLIGLIRTREEQAILRHISSYKNDVIQIVGRSLEKIGGHQRIADSSANDGISIIFSLQAKIQSGDAASSPLIDDDEGLPQFFGQIVCDHPNRNISRTARSKRNYTGHSLVGILRRRGTCTCQQQRRQEQPKKTLHDIPLFMPAERDRLLELAKKIGNIDV